MFLFRYMFAKKKKLTVGSTWVHESVYEPKDPFKSLNVTYKILHVKNNYVLHQALDRHGVTLGIPDSMPARMFYACYRKIED